MVEEEDERMSLMTTTIADADIVIDSAAARRRTHTHTRLINLHVTSHVGSSRTYCIASSILIKNRVNGSTSAAVLLALAQCLNHEPRSHRRRRRQNLCKRKMWFVVVAAIMEAVTQAKISLSLLYLIFQSRRVSSHPVLVVVGVRDPTDAGNEVVGNAGFNQLLHPAFLGLVPSDIFHVAVMVGLRRIHVLIFKANIHRSSRWSSTIRKCPVAKKFKLRKTFHPPELTS